MAKVSYNLDVLKHFSNEQLERVFTEHTEPRLCDVYRVLGRNKDERKTQKVTVRKVTGKNKSK